MTTTMMMMTTVSDAVEHLHNHRPQGLDKAQVSTLLEHADSVAEGTRTATTITITTTTTRARHQCLAWT